MLAEKGIGWIGFQFISLHCAYGLFACQYENEPEDESFRSFWIKPVSNEPGPQYYDTLKDRFVRHAYKFRNEPKLLFVLEVMHDERTDPLIYYYYSTKAWFVRHRLYPERTKTFVFGFDFVFVLAHEQPISSIPCTQW